MRAFDGFAVEHMELEGGSAISFSRETGNWYLALHDLQLEAGEIEINNGELKEGHRTDLRGTMTLLPPAARASGWSKPLAAKNSFTALYFSPELLSPELGELFAAEQPGPILYETHDAISRTLCKIRDLLQAGHEGRMPLEQLAIVAACEVQSLARPEPLATKGAQLSHRQLAQARNFMFEHIAADLSLDDLAQAAGLSRFHFSRAFAATTGMSPYAFLTVQRTELASKLLTTTNLPLEDVARQSGLGSMTNLRRAITKRHGTTPTAFRRSVQA